MKLIRVSWIFICFFSLAYGWSEEQPLQLSIERGENIVIQNNYTINAALHRLEQGYHGFRASKAYFKPQLNFSSDIDFAQNDNALDAVLKLTQPLYDKVAFYQLKEAQIQWEMSKFELQTIICDILFDFRTAYHTVLLNQAHLAIDEIVIKLWSDELKKQERFFELGDAIPFEINQTKLHLKNAWRDYYDTQSEIQTSQIQLLTILGLAPNTPLHLIEKEISFPTFDHKECVWEKWKERALKYRPQLKQEQFAYLLSQNKVSQTKAENLPTLSFYANAGNRYVNNGFTGQPYVGTGVNLNWMLYDPTNKPRTKQAEEVRREAASNYYQVELETEAIIYALLKAIDKSFLAYQNAHEGAILAKQGMEMATRKRELGLMSAFEYRDTIETMHEAQSQVNQTLFDLHQAYHRLIKETGLDLCGDR